jgi:hypothetical protein
MMNMHTGYGSILGLKKIFMVIILITVSFFAIGMFEEEISPQLGVLTSIITFVYGFYLNSLFNFIQKKYNDFTVNMSDLSANAQALFNLAKVSGQKKFMEEVNFKLAELVDLLKDLSPRNYYQTQKCVDGIFQSLNNYKITNKKQEVLLARIINVIRDLSISRERVELFGVRFIVGETKFLFFTLTTLVCLSILSISFKLSIMLLFGLVLIFSLVFFSIFLLNLDRNKFGKEKVRVANLNQLLDGIK